MSSFNSELWFSKLASFDKLLFKTLSKNDTVWAEPQSGVHQAGMLINRDLATFFPAKDDSDTFTAEIPAHWAVDTAWLPKIAKWKFYSTKTEYRITTLPREPFQGLGPGSLLLIGKQANQYYGVVIDSADQTRYEAAIEQLDLLEAPTVGLLERDVTGYVQPGIPVEQSIPEDLDVMPGITELNDGAIEGFATFRPHLHRVRLARPGDYLDELLNYQFEQYKQYESVVYSRRIANSMQGADFSNLKRAIFAHMEALSREVMSMHQARKSRVGKSFEFHIRKFLDELEIPYDFQKKVDGKKAPDFIIPSQEEYDRADRKADDVVLLSLKTTTRERWQQILNEGSRVRMRYLLTRDAIITKDQIADMKGRSIILVVPEGLKATIAPYAADNVISLKTFFNEMTKRFGKY